MTDPLLCEARTLAGSNPTLPALIRFTRAHDPTDFLRQHWGLQFEQRRDEILTAAQDFVLTGTPFTGSATEVLLCMAHCVVSAPYLGWPEAQVEQYLRALLRRLACGEPPAQPAP